jgi:hypothetical protein
MSQSQSECKMERLPSLSCQQKTKVQRSILITDSGQLSLRENMPATGRQVHSGFLSNRERRISGELRE